MASRTLAYQGESGLCNSPDPLEEPTVDEEGHGHGVGPHQESCHDRRLQHRLGGAVQRQTDLRPLVEGGERLPHQLLGNASSLSSLPVFPAGPNRTPCADSLRQHVCGVLYKSPGRCLLEAPLYSGRAPSGMGSAQHAFAEGSTPAGQTEPRSGYVISEQCPLRGVDAPSAGGSEDLEDLWQGRSRPFRLQRQLSLPNLLFEGQGRVSPRLTPFIDCTFNPIQRYFQPRSELRSSRSPRFLRLRRTGSYLCYALSELWESTLSVPPLLGVRNSSLLASVTVPKGIRSRSRDSLSG